LSVARARYSLPVSVIRFQLFVPVRVPDVGLPVWNSGGRESGTRTGTNNRQRTTDMGNGKRTTENGRRKTENGAV
jgi:hypothetical protein